MFARSVLVIAATVALLSGTPVAQATYLGHNGKIAYQRGNEVWTINADGSGQTLLAADANDPAWSADGRRIAYGCRLDSIGNSTRVCTAAADGSSETVLDNQIGSPMQRPTWSREGLWLAVDTAICHSSSVCFSELWRVDSSDGADPIRLEFGYKPSWSVNGLIAFHQFGTNPAPGIWVVDPVRPGSSTKIPNSDGVGNADWSPDGEKLVAVGFQEGVGYELFVLDRDGSGLTRLTDNTVDELDPVWSPDGTKIAFVRRSGGTYDVWVMNADGSGETQITATSEFKTGLAWQPEPQAGYVRPKSASPLKLSLVPAFERCSDPNRQHGPPLSFGSCAPPARRAGFMTFGSAPTGTSPKSVGHVHIAVIPGDPDSVNRADVNVTASLRDVRRGFDLADGPGSLELVLPVRITDLGSGPFGSDHQATVTDLDNYMTNPLRFLVPCAETADPAFGSTCSASTTVNALFGSNFAAVRERKRAIWQFDQVAVWDGGEDGFIESRDDNTVLAVQGVFVP